MHLGQEIYLFFNKYGAFGLVGIIVSMMIMTLIIYKVLKISCKNSDIKTYSNFIDKIMDGKKKDSKFNITTIIQNVINIFLLITFYIMIAGFAAYFKQEFGFNQIIGSVIIAIFCYITFNKDINGIIKVNSLVVPAIIGLIILLGIGQGKEIKVTNLIFENSNWKWVISGILYASYNSILLIPMLISLKKQIREEKHIKIISIICMIILIVLSVVIFLLIETIENPENIELPLVYIAGSLKSVYKYLYGVVILSAIFTTAISAGYGFLNNVSKNKKEYLYLNLFICVSSVLVSNIGFSNLISYLYPVFGVLGIVQIFYICKFVGADDSVRPKREKNV